MTQPACMTAELRSPPTLQGGLVVGVEVVAWTLTVAPPLLAALAVLLALDPRGSTYILGLGWTVLGAHSLARVVLNQVRAASCYLIQENAMNNSMTIECPHCSRHLNVGPSRWGRRLDCPSCQRAMHCPKGTSMSSGQFWEVLLRLSTGLMLSLLILGMAASILLESRLPEPLRYYSGVQADNLNPMLLLAMPILVTHLVAIVGLFTCRAWARVLFAVTYLALSVATPLFGVTIEHGITDALLSGVEACAGAILFMCLFWERLRHGSHPLPRDVEFG